MKRKALIGGVALLVIFAFAGCGSQTAPAAATPPAAPTSDTTAPDTTAPDTSVPASAVAETDPNITGINVSGGAATAAMKDGSFKPLTGDVTLANGVTVSKTGKVTFTDGSTAQFNDGEGTQTGAMVLFVAGQMYKPDGSK